MPVQGGPDSHIRVREGDDLTLGRASGPAGRSGPLAHRMARLEVGSGRPRVMRLPADWWDAPSAVGCPLSRGPQAAREARRLTRDTLCDWGLMALAEDAETIVGELAANAVTHAVTSLPGHGSAGGNPCLRLLRHCDEVTCAVLDPSGAAPVLKRPGGVEEAGRGLQIVDALSDVWGWSPLAAGGKAVWAILFVHSRLAQ